MGVALSVASASATAPRDGVVAADIEGEANAAAVNDIAANEVAASAVTLRSSAVEAIDRERRAMRGS